MLYDKIMKNLKFRVWDKEEKKMVYDNNSGFCNYGITLGGKWGEYAVQYCGGEESGVRFTEEQIQIHPLRIEKREPSYELLQSSGLKDKNGKDIYEGDIVKDIDGTTEEVKYYEDYAGFLPFANRSFDFDILKPEECEVIGNVYESKHLLGIAPEWYEKRILEIYKKDK